MNVGICLCILLAALSSGSITLPSHAMVRRKAHTNTRAPKIVGFPHLLKEIKKIFPPLHPYEQWALWCFCRFFLLFFWSISSNLRQTVERYAVSLILSQPQRVEGEVLTSDTLPPQHSRQARSAPAPPSGQQANYNKAQDDADLRSSLSQLLARLLSRKGENSRETKWTAPPIFVSPPPFRSPPCLFSSPPREASSCDRPSLTLCLSLTIWHFPASFPPPLFLPCLLPSLPPSWPRSAVALIESALPCHVNTAQLGELLSWLVIQKRRRGNCDKKWKRSSWSPPSFIDFTLKRRLWLWSPILYYPNDPLSREHLPALVLQCVIISHLCRLSVPDQILRQQQGQWALPQPQDKGQRLPRLDGLWTSQRRGVRVLLLKARLTDGGTWIRAPPHAHTPMTPANKSLPDQ